MSKKASNTCKAPTRQLLKRFSTIVGEANAIDDPAEMAPFLREWRDLYAGQAALVLKPRTVDEVSQILILANKSGTAIVPQGGNTGLVGAQIPFESGHEVVLNLSRMNAIRDVDPLSNTMTVEAGVILENAQRAADEAGRLFPLSLASEGSCQIGGNLATNAGGTAVLAYGNARDLVLGLEVVLADGRIWEGLRALKKDNTGYDLRDLFIGSEGTLGIITAAVLKLVAKPAERACAFVGLNSLENVAQLFEASANAAASNLTAFEVMPRIGLEFAIKHGSDARDPLERPHPWYALIEISGARADGRADSMLESILAQAIEDGLASDAVLAASLTQAKSFWQLRELLSEVQKHEGGSIKHDVSVPVARVPDLIKQASACVEAMIPGCRPVPFGHFGDGNIHFNVSQPIGMERDAFMANWDRVTQAVHDIVLSLEGSIGAEHGVGRMKRALLARVKSDVELSLMVDIKRVLDPNGILNPGKLL